MRIAIAALFTVIALALAGCMAPPKAIPDPAPVPISGPDVVRFLVVGDTGTGAPAQFDVAEAMKTVCDDLGCDFALLLGDAIYETGVSSATDPQFQTKFEQPYAAFDIPFYVVLGNHDYGGDGFGYDASKAPYYLEYAKTSERWAMPGLNYVVDTAPIDLFALDSGSITVHGSPSSTAGTSLAEQKEWLADAIAKSDAPWKMTFAHHPYISNGKHGDAGSYDGAPMLGAGWKDLLETTACGKVDFHLAGHDHDLQWLRAVPACGDTEFIVSGAGAKQRTAGAQSHEARFEGYATQGFVWMQADATRLTVRFYNDDGGVLYHAVRDMGLATAA